MKTILLGRNIRMLVNNRLVRVNWADGLKEDLYEVGITYLYDDYAGGGQTWLMRASSTEGLVPIRCLQYKEMKGDSK